MTSVSSSRPRCFRSVISAADGWSVSWHCSARSLRQVAVLVPAAVVELDEAHAALGQPPRQQAVGGEGAGLARVGAVQLEGVLPARSTGRSAPARRSACGRPSRTARCAWRSRDRRSRRSCMLVELAERVEHRRGASSASMPGGIRRGTAPDRRRRGTCTPWCCDGRKPLPHRREKSGWSALMPLRLRDQHDERRQVLVLAAQAVAEPGADARAARAAGCRSG